MHPWFTQGLNPAALSFNDAIVEESWANQPSAEVLDEVGRPGSEAGCTLHSAVPAVCCLLPACCFTCLRCMQMPTRQSRHSGCHMCKKQYGGLLCCLPACCARCAGAGNCDGGR